MWQVAKWPPKYSGIGWRTGLHTYGTNYLTSITKNAEHIERIVHHWDATSIAEREVGEWLNHQAGPGHKSPEMFRSIRDLGRPQRLLSEDGHRLSIAQW